MRLRLPGNQVSKCSRSGMPVWSRITVRPELSDDRLCRYDSRNALIALCREQFGMHNITRGDIKEVKVEGVNLPLFLRVGGGDRIQFAVSDEILGKALNGNLIDATISAGRQLKRISLAVGGVSWELPNLGDAKLRTASFPQLNQPRSGPMSRNPPSEWMLLSRDCALNAFEVGRPKGATRSIGCGLDGVVAGVEKEPITSPAIELGQSEPQPSR